MSRAILLGVWLLSACGPRLIPGTELDDTDDNQRVLAVINEYRANSEAKNVDAVLNLVSMQFYDDGGTAEPQDDLDAAGLRKKLAAEWSGRVKQVRMEIQVKKIFVEGDTARARYFYTIRYQVGEDWQQDMDAKEMLFKREGGVWKILSGV